MIYCFSLLKIEFEHAQSCVSKIVCWNLNCFYEPSTTPNSKVGVGIYLKAKSREDKS